MLSVRKGKTSDGRGVLRAYRKFERTHPKGTAYETPRGMWIASVSGKPMEAFDNEKAAADYLKNQED